MLNFWICGFKKKIYIDKSDKSLHYCHVLALDVCIFLFYICIDINFVAFEKFCGFMTFVQDK